MGIVSGQALTSVEISEDYKPQVVVKFKPGSGSSVLESMTAHGAANAPDERWERLSRAHSGIALRPYFSVPANSTLEAFSLDSGARDAGELSRCYLIQCESREEAQHVELEMSAWLEVEYAYVEAGPTPPPVNPVDDPRSANQGYLDAAPRGIEARWAWALADGRGVGFVDLKRGWTLNHEDLAAAGISLISGVNQDFHGHGTAVLGEVVAVDNSLGGVGAAPSSRVRVVSQWRGGGLYKTADAIASAAAAMQRGDVLLLEAQTTYAGGGIFLPVEVEDLVFDAIVAATARGIVVVEAGGNGSFDLDTFQTTAGKQVLNRRSPQFRDSGAIMVGAGSATVPHRRLSFSNHGSRIDCFAWGESIDTAGDGWSGNGINTYTTGFGGTSGASPIVSGAALLVQAARLRAGKAVLAPAAIRAVLSSTSLNTPSERPATDRIGVMPNLRSIIQSDQHAPPGAAQWDLINRVLFGDGGLAESLAVRSDERSVPAAVLGLADASDPKRQLLLGMAVIELARLASDDSSRSELHATGLRVMQRVLNGLSAPAPG